MRKVWVAWLLMAGLGQAGPCTAWADLFLLNNGGRIEGELLNADESPRTSYQIQTPFGGRLTLETDQVERVEVRSDAEKVYAERVNRVPDTADGHWKAAQWCEQAKLTGEREFHLEQVLRHDPEHEGARRALGYSRLEGRWVRPDDFMGDRGYVRVGGAWRLPQEIALSEAAGKQQQATVEWRKNIKMWSDWIVKGRGRGSEGEASIRAIRDPAAAPALAELLMDRKQPRPLRRLYFEVLSAVGGNVAEATFARLAIEDPDPLIRDRCLEVLGRWQSKYAVQQFINLLKDPDNPTVNRAGAALAALKDPAATRPLIDALITEHKRLVGGGGINPSFSDQGSGLSMGGKPKIVKEKMRNESVLTALTVIYPGVNFGFNQPEWLRWYAERNTPKSVNLRRSD